MEPDRRPRDPSYLLPQVRDHLRLRIGEALAVDAESFEADLDAAEAAEVAGSPELALERYEQGLARYRGDYLADAVEPGWGEHERTRLRSRFVTAALRAAALRLGQAEFDRALGWASRAVAANELSEAARRMQAIVYVRRGDRVAAREALAAGLRALAAAGLSPESDTERLAVRLGVRR